MIRNITKRDGTVVEFDADKLTHWARWASVVGVDWFAIVGDAYKRCPDNCTTQDLHNAMIQACADYEDTPHMMMAGRLLVGDVYKQAFGGHEKIPTVKDMYKSMVERGFWEEMDYTDEELDIAQSFIMHNRDLNSIHSVVHQISTKYSITDVETGKVLESPQFTWMRMALGICKGERRGNRMREVFKHYMDLALGDTNAPTPNIRNLGTLKRNYASCCVFKSGDDSDSLAAGDHIAYVMTCASAGIGGYLETRTKHDGVRNNTIKHGGKFSYHRNIEGNVHANLQGGRGGAATMHIKCLDPEIMMLLRLRHPTTPTKSRIGGIDYSFGYHPYLAEKAAKNEDWMLVSFKDAPHLYEAMHKGDDSFVEAYNEYERGKGKRKHVKARKLALEFLRMQEETGRMYEHNTYEMNRHTPFKDTIWSSNLCQEIGLPTREFLTVTELYGTTSEGEIGLCNLGAIKAGSITPDKIKDVAYRTLKMVDNVIDIMDYPFPHLEYTAKARRSVGIGITDLAHDMAMKGLRYDTAEGKAYLHRMAEMHSFWLHVASVELAKERGACDWFHKTKYADGWLPIDTYHRGVDEVTDQPLLCDWEWLRGEIAKYGMRNSVLEAFMPVESSSVAGNTTNSLYPIRDLSIVKKNGTNKSVFLAPDMEMLKDRYQMAWNISRRDMIDVYAIFQKFCGQAISVDLYRAFGKDQPKRISARELLEDWFYRIRRGLKTVYYSNTRAGHEMPLVEAEDDCESCKL
jgi:ribonucleoside-diphosphate reductase alpha subunit